MKFTDGLWQLRPGVTALYVAEAYDIHTEDDAITVTAPTTVITRRGDTLNRPVLTLRLSSPLENVIRVRIDPCAPELKRLGLGLVVSRRPLDAPCLTLKRRIPWGYADRWVYGY